MLILIFLILIILIYIFSLNNIKNVYFLLFEFTKNQKITKILISALFLPGTILHELSHFFAAIALFLNVRGLEIFPKFESDQIKLGSVLYDKKDPVRGVLVGIAPIFGALGCFFAISYFNLFPSSNLLLNIILIYLFFTISSTMFSSKQDLVDLIYIIPFILVFLLIKYLFQINITFSIKNQVILNALTLFLEKTNQMLLISLLIHIILLILSTILLRKK
ncbi:MAG: hypothetical protein Fur009_7450 [Candidatus Microgenomates bacterium]